MTEAKDKGWIKVNRSEMEEWMWDEDSPFDKFHAWIDILLNANYKKKEIPFGSSVITIEPGCVLTSVLKLSKRWRWNRRTVTRFLALLKDSNKIEYESFKNGLMIKVKTHNPNPESQSDSDSFFYTPSEQPSAQSDAQDITQPHTQSGNTTNKVINNTECNNVRTEETPAQPKINFADNVLLTVKEYDSLVFEFGRQDTDSAIKFLESYKQKTGKHYESDYHAIKKWGINAVNEQKNKNGGDFTLLKTEDSEEDFERLMWKKMNKEA